MNDKAPQIDQIPVIRISVQRPLSETGALVFETYAPQDMPLKDLNGLMDKLADAGDRQFHRADADRLDRELANLKAEWERQVDGLNDMDRLFAEKAKAHEAEGRRVAYKLPDNEAKAREGVVRGITMLQQKIAQVERRIAELRAEFQQAAE